MDGLPPSQRKRWQEESGRYIVVWMGESSEGRPVMTVPGQTMKRWRISRREFDVDRVLSLGSVIGAVVGSEAWLRSAQKKPRCDDLVHTVRMSSLRWMERWTAFPSDREPAMTQEMPPR